MLIERLAAQLRERETRSLRRRRRVVESPCAAHQVVGSEGAAESMLTFCSNDYLGLANHPLIIDAWIEGARRYGVGSGGSHLIGGHGRAHAELEAELAAFLAPCIPNPAALYFSSGYMANLAVLTALGAADATLFSDALNHASLIDGSRLAKAPCLVYPHGDTASLDALLAGCASPLKLIVTDAVFSMDGDLADLSALLALAERHDAWIVLDDAHGFGVLGDQGRGTLSHFGLRSARLISMGTLGKAAGVSGAFVVADRTVIDWLVQVGRSYIYTTAAPPAIAHALRASLRLIAGDEGQTRRMQLQRHIADLRQRLASFLTDRPDLGFRLTESATAIQPLIVGGNEAALQLSAALQGRGLWIPAIRPPTVPVGTARLRIALSADHTAADLDRLVDTLAQVTAPTAP